MVELLTLAHDRGCEAGLADQLQLGLDAARLSLQLNELRLPAIKVLWPQFGEQADKEGWPAARLPAGKTIDSFDFNAVPMISKTQVMAITAGDAWIAKRANVMTFGPPGSGKSHLAAA